MSEYFLSKLFIINNSSIKIGVVDGKKALKTIVCRSLSLCPHMKWERQRLLTISYNTDNLCLLSNPGLFHLCGPNNRR